MYKGLFNTTSIANDTANSNIDQILINELLHGSTKFPLKSGARKRKVSAEERMYNGTKRTNVSKDTNARNNQLVVILPNVADYAEVKISME